MITIRQAMKSEYPKLIEIMNKAADREELRGFVPPEGACQEFLIQLKRQLELLQHGVFVSEMNHEPVGFVFFIHKDDCFEIEEIDVVKEY